jgi:hypothetical protein
MAMMLRVTLILSYLLSLSVAWTTSVISHNVGYQFPRLSRFHRLGANKKNVVVPIQKSKSAIERINGQATPSKTGLDKIMYDTNSALDILKENVGQLQVTDNTAASLTVQGDTEEEEGELKRKSERQDIRVPAPTLLAPTQLVNKVVRDIYSQLSF